MKFVASLLLLPYLQVALCHEECKPCQTRRRLSNAINSVVHNKIKKPTNETGEDLNAEIKKIIENASQKVEAVAEFSNLNSLVAHSNVGLKVVSGVVDSVSLSFLGFLRELAATLDAIPIVNVGSSGIINGLSAVDDVFFDVLDVVLVFIRDDLLGAVFSDSKEPSNSTSTLLATAGSLTDVFPPMESLVDGIAKSMETLEDMASDPVALKQASVDASKLTPETVTPIVAPLIVLESIISNAGVEIACLLGMEDFCDAGDEFILCTKNRLLCSVKSVVFDEISQLTPEPATNDEPGDETTP